MVNGLHLYLTCPVFVTTIPAFEKHKSQLPIHTIMTEADHTIQGSDLLIRDN